MAGRLEKLDSNNQKRELTKSVKPLDLLRSGSSKSSELSEQRQNEPADGSHQRREGTMQGTNGSRDATLTPKAALERLLDGKTPAEQRAMIQAIRERTKQREEVGRGKGPSHENPMLETAIDENGRSVKRQVHLEAGYTKDRPGGLGGTERQADLLVSKTNGEVKKGDYIYNYAKGLNEKDGRNYLKEWGVDDLPANVAQVRQRHPVDTKLNTVEEGSEESEGSEE